MPAFLHQPLDVSNKVNKSGKDDSFAEADLLIDPAPAEVMDQSNFDYFHCLLDYNSNAAGLQFAQYIFKIFSS